MFEFTRAAALVELNGEVLVLKMSQAAWSKVMDIAAQDNGGKLVAAPAANQQVLDELSQE